MKLSHLSKADTVEPSLSTAGQSDRTLSEYELGGNLKRGLLWLLNACAPHVPKKDPIGMFTNQRFWQAIEAL